MLGDGRALRQPIRSVAWRPSARGRRPMALRPRLTSGFALVEDGFAPRLAPCRRCLHEEERRWGPRLDIEACPRRRPLRLATPFAFPNLVHVFRPGNRTRVPGQVFRLASLGACLLTPSTESRLPRGGESASQRFFSTPGWIRSIGPGRLGSIAGRPGRTHRIQLHAVALREEPPRPRLPRQ